MPSGKASDSVAPIVITVLVSFVTAWVLAGATVISWKFYGEGSFLASALLTGIILWRDSRPRASSPMMRSTNVRRGLTILNIPHELVTIVIMAPIIGVWPPA